MSRLPNLPPTKHSLRISMAPGYTASAMRPYGRQCAAAALAHQVPLSKAQADEIVSVWGRGAIVNHFTFAQLAEAHHKIGAKP